VARAGDAADSASDPGFGEIGYDWWPRRAPDAAPASPPRAGVRVNSRPPVKPTTVEPFKHVIDEYKHQAQTITCTCGWHGSSATLDRGGSEWTAHLFEVRGKKR